MLLHKALTASVLAASMVSAPALAEAPRNQAAASKLSIASSPLRQGAQVTAKKSSRLRGGNLPIIIGGVVAVGVGIAVAASGSSSPASP